MNTSRWVHGFAVLSSKGPASLEGHNLSFAGAPNRYGLGPFYKLQVWAWKANPAGTFADMNPDASWDVVRPGRLVGHPIQRHSATVDGGPPKKES